jgi:hypothetical protein
VHPEIFYARESDEDMFCELTDIIESHYARSPDAIRALRHAIKVMDSQGVNRACFRAAEDVFECDYGVSPYRDIH